MSGEERKEVRRKLFPSTNEDGDNVFMEQLMQDSQAKAEKKLARYNIICELPANGHSETHQTCTTEQPNNNNCKEQQHPTKTN
jgi:hypothetical protein